jgi:hypothetical protein
MLQSRGEPSVIETIGGLSDSTTGARRGADLGGMAVTVAEKIDEQKMREYKLRWPSDNI